MSNQDKINEITTDLAAGASWRYIADNYGYANPESAAGSVRLMLTRWNLTPTKVRRRGASMEVDEIRRRIGYEES